MERGIIGKLLKKWLQLIKKKKHLFVCACVMSISRNIYEVIFSDKIRSTQIQVMTMMMMMENYSPIRNVLLSQKRVVLLQSLTHHQTKGHKGKGKESPHYHLCQCFLRLHLHRPHHLPPQLLWQASHFLDLVLEDIIQNLLSQVRANNVKIARELKYHQNKI